MQCIVDTRQSNAEKNRGAEKQKLTATGTCCRCSESQPWPDPSPECPWWRWSAATNFNVVYCVCACYVCVYYYSTHVCYLGGPPASVRWWSTENGEQRSDFSSIIDDQKTPKLAYQRGPFSERKEFCPGYSTAQQLVYRPVVMAGKSGFLPPVPGRVTGQG
jgi:hypothetical protein